jgi:hypothetical protein
MNNGVENINQQYDDLVYNYLVVRCSEYVELDYYKQVKIIACIYMC